MKYVAAYLLANLGGNANPSTGDLESILGSVGAEFEKENAETVVKLLNGKEIDEVISSGLTKLATVPSGGGSAAPAASSAAPAQDKPAEKPAEKKEAPKEESDDDMAVNDQALIQIRLNSGCFKGRDVDELNSKDSLVIYNFLCSLLAYSLRTLTVADGSRYANIVVLIDSSRVPVKVLRVVLRACQNALAYKIKQAVVIAPERFLDQQRMSLDILLDAYDFKKFEDHFRANPAYFGTETSSSCISYLYGFFKCDQSIMIELASETTRLNSESKIAIREDRLEINSDEEVEKPTTSNKRTTKTQNKTVDSTPQMHVLEARALRLQEIIGWLDGPVEMSLRQFSTQICETMDEVERLISEHEPLTNRICELKNEIDELAAKMEQLDSTSEFQSLWDKVTKRLNEMDGRVRQSVNKTDTLKRFHEIKFEFYKEADVLLKSLCSDPKDLDLAILKKNLQDLDFKTQIIEDRFEEAVKACTTFCTLDKDVRPAMNLENGPALDVAYVSEQLSFLNERRKRCLGLSDMRRLKIQQYIQLLTCESDAQQVIQWINELRVKFLRAGDPITKIAKLDDVSKKMEKYGTELLEVSLLLRRSLRLDIQLQVKLNEQFQETCRQFNETISHFRN
ncbi:CRAL-TRIO domain-containing protein [Aphelenchoides besseyi]|nr:CRAL-TRIO domain-containing protein [Aphelenchoides besseyi]